MSTLALVLGIVIVVVVTIDFLLTTIGAAGQAVFSKRLCKGVFFAYREVASRHQAAWYHKGSGPLVMAVLSLTWIASLAFGWALIYLGIPDAIGTSEGQPPAGFWLSVAHSGHLLSTLGGGITEPGHALSAVVGVAVAVNGMIILTLGVSFILSVTNGVAASRRFCAMAEAEEEGAPVDYSMIASTLSETVAMLKTAPFALFYSAESPYRRLPTRIVRFARRMEARDEFASYRPFLDDLPGFDARPERSDDRYVRAISGWAEAYELVPRGDAADLEGDRRAA